MNLILIIVFTIAVGEGDVGCCIVHASFESIENSEVVTGAQPVRHVTPTLLKNGDKVWIISDPGRDPRVRGGGVSLAFGSKVQ
jgi:uncharacterized Zn ribbon protein